MLSCIYVNLQNIFPKSRLPVIAHFSVRIHFTLRNGGEEGAYSVVYEISIEFL